MPTTTLFRARIDTGHKAAAEKILAKLGLRPADAVNLLFAQIAVRRGLPFSVSLADAADEYGVTPGQLAAALSRLDEETEQVRTAGALVSGLEAIEAEIDRRRYAGRSRARRRTA